MDAGRLDRRITILRATTSANGFNEPVETWSDFATVWAAAAPVMDGEKWAAGQTLATQSIRFTVRWSYAASTITPTDRVRYDGRVYDINGVKDMGRNEFRELTATARAE